jgi:hypothetical protein
MVPGTHARADRASRGAGRGILRGEGIVENLQPQLRRQRPGDRDQLKENAYRDQHGVREAARPKLIAIPDARVGFRVAVRLGLAAAT